MILGLLFLGLQTFFSFFRPKYFVISYLLYTSSFLGFFTKDIIVGGADIGMFYQSMLMLGSYIVFYKQKKFLPKYLKRLLAGSILIFFFGILYPAVTGLATFSQSIFGSKEFSTIFFMHYLLIFHKKLDFKFIYKVLSFFGYYFLFILLFYAILKIAPPLYMKRVGMIQYYFPTILSLFLFIKMAKANTFFKKVTAFLLLIIWTVGMYFEGHAAITITTIIGCLIILYRIPVIQFFKNYRTIFTGLIFLGLMFILLPADQYIEEFKQDEAIQSRSFVNTQRLELIKEKPWLGYGFLHRNAFEFESNNKYALELSFIDSGYIDLLGKFGLLGTVFYLILLTVPFLMRNASILALSLKIYFAQYFLINITWSVFSFSVGLVALSLLISLQLSEYSNTDLR